LLIPIGRRDSHASRLLEGSERINLIKLLTIVMRATASLYASQNAVRSRLFPELNARLSTETLLPLPYRRKLLFKKSSCIAINIKSMVQVGST
jgi:hypothetical protein